MQSGRAQIAVVGGANMDIGGFSDSKLRIGDSNPGHVHLSAGGVGRNIAENAARLGMDVRLISAIGDDANGRILLEDCRQKGIRTDGCRIGGGRTSVYLFIGDERGDMHCAVSDMEIQNTLTPEFLATRLDELNAMDAVAMDANLPEESIRFLAESVKVPLFADPVSAAKVERLRGALKHLYCLKPNRMEAELLSGMRIWDANDAKTAARRLNAAGLRRVFVTMGLEGAVCAEDGKCSFIPCAVSKAVNATGAGDAFTAALVWAHCEGFDLEQSCAAGMAASTISVESMATVSPEMSRENLMRKMAEFSIG